MNQLMKFARDFRMYNPLTEFGNSVYQPNQPTNITLLTTPTAHRQRLCADCSNTFTLPMA